MKLNELYNEVEYKITMAPYAQSVMDSIKALSDACVEVGFPLDRIPTLSVDELPTKRENELKATWADQHCQIIRNISNRFDGVGNVKPNTDHFDLCGWSFSLGYIFSSGGFYAKHPTHGITISEKGDLKVSTDSVPLLTIETFTSIQSVWVEVVCKLKIAVEKYKELELKISKIASLGNAVQRELDKYQTEMGMVKYSTTLRILSNAKEINGLDCKMYNSNSYPVQVNSLKHIEGMKWLRNGKKVDAFSLNEIVKYVDGECGVVL